LKVTLTHASAPDAGSWH